MIRLGGKNVLLGGFHDHWSRADGENPTLLLAALTYYHYDFVILMDGPESCAVTAAAANAFSRKLRIYPGYEEATGWAHIVTVNPRRPPLEGDDADFRRVFRALKASCDLVILGHPNYIAWEPLVETGEMDRLLDEGLLDGVQATMFSKGGVFGTRDAWLGDWYRKRVAAGRRTAVVGGWDVHGAVPAGVIPHVLYTHARPPDGHFETGCDNRTLVLAEENRLEAIVAAVRAGDTAVENMRSGEIIGAPDVVELLTRHGYREAVAELDRKRDAVSLTLVGPWLGGAAGQLTVSHAGQVLVPTVFDRAVSIPAQAGLPLDLPCIPLLLPRDQTWLPVAWQGDDGSERIWAVEAAHPIRFDVLPRIDAAGPAVEFAPAAPFAGSVTLQAGAAVPDWQGEAQGRIVIPADRHAVTGTPIPFRCEARLPSGMARVETGFLTFLPVHRFHGAWEDVPPFGVDEARYVPKSAYGMKRPWPGPDVFSARLQFAWTAHALLFRATVRDDVHFQPHRGHYAYNADCLQLALDPLLRRAGTIGSIYSFNLSLSPDGPELFRWLSPTEEAGPGFTPPVSNVSLGERYLDVTPWSGGLVYTLTLPWSELAPAHPAPGMRMGVYYIMFNNNGAGHLDTMHWPVPIEGMWTVPRKWGTLTLLDG